MRRRSFLAAAIPGKTHLVTLSFDDGLKKSFHRIAGCYERFGLRACLNVIATGHQPGFAPVGPDGLPDIGIAPFEKGNFEDWNRLKQRGHEVMAHSYDHVRLPKLPLEEAKASIDKCAAYFEQHLKGFKTARSVYSFAYNSSTPELEQHALTKFAAIRTQGALVNPIPAGRGRLRIGCRSYGPGNCDAFVGRTVEEFLASPGGWYVFNGHGLDEEGWGPMSTSFLVTLLERLTRLRHVAVWPAGEVALGRRK